MSKFKLDDVKAEDSDTPRIWLMCRPAGEGGWLVLSEAEDANAWTDLKAELMAQLEYGDQVPLEVMLASMTRAEVDALEEFGGW